MLRRLFFKQNMELLEETIGDELLDQFKVKRILDEEDEKKYIHHKSLEINILSTSTRISRT